MNIRTFLFGTRQRFPSSIEALRKFTSRMMYETVQREETDQRYIIQHIARLQGITEIEMLTRIGKRLRLPLETQVSPIPLQILPTGVTTAKLRRVGAIPFMVNGEIKGFVCIEPKLLDGLETQFQISDPEVRLGTWFSIARALDQTERHAREAEEREQNEKQRRMTDTSLKVIRLMITDVESYGAHSVTINASAQALAYSFCTAQGKQARGVLDSRIRESILSQFRMWITADNGRVRLQGAAQNADGVLTSGEKVIAITENQSEGTIRLSWDNAESRESQEVIGSVPRTTNDLQTSGGQIIPLFAVPQKSEAQEGRPENMLTVLLVDDNPTFSKVLSRFLERSGMTALHAGGGGEAFTLLEDGAALPALIVCDVHMPDMNGFEFLRRIRSDERFKHIPVIMLTSDNNVETELALVQTGADVFLTKTEDPRILCAHAQRLAQQKRAA